MNPPSASAVARENEAAVRSSTSANGSAPPERPARENGAPPADHDSPNLHKYTSGGGVYHWHLRQFMHVLYEEIARTAPRSLLDAGCGEGFVTRFLREQNAGWQLTGVDLCEDAIAYARAEDDQTRYLTGDLYDLPFDDDAFDTVLCSEVLEHLDRPNRAFAELHRVARRAVVVSVPREPYFQWLNDLGQALGLSPDPGHVNFWDEDGFRRFVRQHLVRSRFRTKHIYQIVRGRVTP